MASKRHGHLQRKAAGLTGRIEVPLPSSKIIDVATKAKAVEIQRVCTSSQLLKAAERLKESGKSQRVLQVPDNCMPLARQAMRKAGVSGSIKNLSGTKRSFVAKPKPR